MRKAERGRQRASGVQRERATDTQSLDYLTEQSGLPPSETLHRHCETSRESQRVRADMTV